MNSTIWDLIIFIFMIVATFVAVFWCEKYYGTKILYDGNKDKRIFLKKQPVIFTCDSCGCHFEIGHAKELSNNRNMPDHMCVCRCPLCGSKSTGQWLKYEDYIEKKKEITSEMEDDNAET